MANEHRRFLEPFQIEGILRSHGIDPPPLVQEVLAGGTFNTVYRLRFADRLGVVLKLSPDPAGAAMTYESGILRTEELFYTQARGRLPVPEVIGLSPLGLESGAGEVLLVSELPGVPWSESGLPVADRPALRAQLGELVAGLHQVTGPAFGYPSESTGALTPHWDDAFAAMMDAVLADAVLYRADLPVSAQRVRRAVADAGSELATVRVPTLVHFDLWDGNVLLDLGGTARISGIIDGERAMWGDPVVDFVSTALLGEIRDDADFIRGYQAAGAVLPLDQGARRRLLLYRIYLGLIMTVEPIPRGYGDDRQTEFTRQVSDLLVADLAELESFS